MFSPDRAKRRAEIRATLLGEIAPLCQGGGAKTRKRGKAATARYRGQLQGFPCSRRGPERNPPRACRRQSTQSTQGPG